MPNGESLLAAIPRGRGIADALVPLVHLELVAPAGCVAAADVGLAPPVAEDKGRVADSQGEGGDEDDRGLEDHERDFVLGDGAAEALGELGDTVDGTDEDGEAGDGESCSETRD